MEIVDVANVKKKFDKVFKGAEINYDSRRKIVVNPSHTVMIKGKCLKDLVFPSERSNTSTIKIPEFRQAKTLALIDTKLLYGCLDILKSMKCDVVAIKLISESNHPIELIGVETQYNSPPKADVRILIAPRIEDNEDYDSWVNKETKKKRKAPTKKVATVETPISSIQEGQSPQ